MFLFLFTPTLWDSTFWTIYQNDGIALRKPQSCVTIEEDI